MTTLLDQPFGYGRILSDAHGAVLAIVEEKDASDEQQRIREINAGVYLVDRAFLFAALRQVGVRQQPRARCISPTSSPSPTAKA